MTDGPTPVTTLPDIWLTDDWIMAQVGRSDMTAEELEVVCRTVRAIGMSADRTSLVVHAMVGTLPYPDYLEEDDPEAYSKIKPEGLMTVLNQHQLMRIIRRDNPTVLDTDADIDACRKFIAMLQASEQT